MTDWMALPRTYPDEEKVLRWTPYILELRAEIDALKAPAAPTPVEDEVTEAEREYEPTYDMMQEGCEAYLNAVMQRADRAECDWDGLLAAYRAMRAARVPAPTPEPSAELAALRARCERLAVVVREFEKVEAASGSEPRASWFRHLPVEYAVQLVHALDALRPGDTEEAK